MARPRVLLWQWGRRGGGPRYTIELARALLQEGALDVCLSVSRQSEIHADFKALPASRQDVDTYHDLPSAALSLARLPVVRRDLWRFAAREGVDLVIGTMSHLWNVPMLALGSARPPYLMVLHDVAPHPGDDVPLRHWLLRREVGLSLGVVTLTGHVRERLCADLGYPRQRTWVIPHGVFPYAHPAPPRVGEPLRLLFFGRILPYKGLDLLLEALALVRARGVDVRLTIAGPGDLAPYAARIAALDQVSVDNRWIPEGDIASILQAADVSILPYREASQSGVVAASFAAGIPVVATPVGGLAEQVQDGINGLVCAEATPEAIAQAIARLAGDEGLRLACARGARHSAEHELAWPAIARRFAEAVDALLSMSPGGTR